MINIGQTDLCFQYVSHCFVNQNHINLRKTVQVYMYLYCALFIGVMSIILILENINKRHTSCRSTDVIIAHSCEQRRPCIPSLVTTSARMRSNKPTCICRDVVTKIAKNVISRLRLSFAAYFLPFEIN
jgi:hypothetical protein